MKNIKQYLFAWVCFALSLPLYAQQSITISGSNFTDVVLYRDTRPGNEHTVNTNYSTSSRISGTAWTNGGYPIFWRTLLRFNLSSIPQGAVIQSATLYLYSDPTITSLNAADGNSQLSGSNAFYLEKVTASWNATTVTWNSQPASTTSGRLWAGPSSSATENRQVNVTAFVQDWMNNPSTNHGLKMILENEAYYRSRNYASTDHSNSSIRPRLVVTYVPNDDPFKARMDHVFGALNQSHINTGILTDYGLDLADAILYDGVIRDANLMDIHKWRAGFLHLYPTGRWHHGGANGFVHQIDFQQFFHLQLPCRAGVEPLSFTYSCFWSM